MEEAEKVVAFLRSKGFEAEVCDTLVPIYKCGVVAGKPEQPGDFEGDYVSLPSSFHAHFEVVVRGDSMIEAGIDPGDTLVVDAQNVGVDGDIIVAALNGETTVKTYMKDENDDTWLVPMNEKHAPIKIKESDKFCVLGRVVYIQKQPKISPKLCKRMFERIKPKENDEITINRITKAIFEVKDLIRINRHWYAIFRVLIDRGFYNSINDVYTFVSDLTEIISPTDFRVDAEELKKMAVYSFSKPVALWDENNAPVSGKRYFDYLNIAEKFNKALRAGGK